jgi:group I intron endonuclease
MKAVYQIRSKATNKIYIGGSMDFYARKWNHLWNFKHNRHANKILQNHYNEYGVLDFVFEILKEVSNKHQLKEMEQNYIDELNPFFNICKYSFSTKGRLASEETKAKQSKAMSGYTPCEIARKNSLESCRKDVINLETGIYYESIKEAAEAYNINQSHLVKMLKGTTTNKTNLALAELGYKIQFIKKKKTMTPACYGHQINFILVLNTETGIYYNGIKEAAKTIGFHPQTMKKYIDRGIIPFICA